MNDPVSRPNCIAIIPARGGSERVPGKNIRLFGGKPLISYSIDAARDSGLFQRVVVSTDNDEIAQIAKKHGAEVPFMRPADLADDYTPVSEATADALGRLDPEGTNYEYVAQLMANCPLRDADDVLESFERFRNSAANAQISVVDFGWTNPWWAMQMSESGELLPVFDDQLKARSQDLPPVYAPTGAIWWARVEVLLQERTFHVQGRTGLPLKWHHALDIDTEDDWEVGEFLLRYLDRATSVTEACR